MILITPEQLKEMNSDTLSPEDRRALFIARFPPWVRPEIEERLSRGDHISLQSSVGMKGDTIFINDQPYVSDISALTLIPRRKITVTNCLYS